MRLMDWVLSKIPQLSFGKPSAKGRLSSSRLYHFTPKCEYLLSILQNGFEYRPVNEELPLTGFQSSVFSIPGLVVHPRTFWAVCFCDIPEPMIHGHIKEYGRFGIGLKKTWGMLNGVTPIRYTHYHTPDFDNDRFHTIRGMLSELPRHGGRPSRLFSRILADQGVQVAVTNEEWDSLPENIQVVLGLLDGHLVDVSMHSVEYLGLTRSCEGEWKNRETYVVENRSFYDEREWRALKLKASQGNLSFTLEDVEVLIVDGSSERIKLLDELKKTKGEEFAMKVAAKIKTSEELLLE